MSEILIFTRTWHEPLRQSVAGCGWINTRTALTGLFRLVIPSWPVNALLWISESTALLLLIKISAWKGKPSAIAKAVNSTYVGYMKDPVELLASSRDCILVRLGIETTKTRASFIPFHDFLLDLGHGPAKENFW